MNAKQCKAIRKYVRETFPHMSDEAVYEHDGFGTRRLAVAICKRGMVQHIKTNVKKGVVNV